MGHAIRQFGLRRGFVVLVASGMCLPAWAGGPIASSADHVDEGAHACAFYEHINATGKKLYLDGGRAFRYVGSAWNDKISSIQCGRNCSATTFQHRDYGGARSTWTGNILYVGDSWNDQISSIQVTCR